MIGTILPPSKGYGIHNVVGNFNGPALTQTLHRTYLEHKQIREIMKLLVGKYGFRTVADVGCGYGRMTPILKEYCEGRIEGFERDADFITIARTNMPDIMFHHTDNLRELKAFSGYFDLVFTFTVLQHISDHNIRSVATELKRICSSTLLICEETDSTWQDKTTTGRTIKTYEELFSPFKLKYYFPRIQEPNCPNKQPGHYMVFEK